jgi:CRP-like cAMP-binding protein
MAVDAESIRNIELLAGLDQSQLSIVARLLTREALPADQTIIHQGEPARRFALVESGELVVTRVEGGEPEQLAVVGEGSIVGELGLLRNRVRAASVATRTASDVLVGDREGLLALVDVPEVADRLRALVSHRLAEDASPVDLDAPDGTPLILRPLLPADRAALEAGLDAMSDESLYRRFFTGGRPSERIVDHLLDVDYLDHFAWVLGERHSSEGLALARYYRLEEHGTVAEAAFAVIDGHQGQGLGTLLLGVLATAAAAAGVEQLRAEVLTGNRPMRAVLDKAGASWSTIEAGVVVTEVDVDAAQSLLAPNVVARVQHSVQEIVTAAGLASLP